MFLPNPAVLAAGAGVTTKTYAEFVQHVNERSVVGGAVTWGSNINYSSTPTTYRTTAGSSATGTMAGTSWLNYFANGAIVTRIIQHGLPSQVVFNEQRSSGRQVLFTIYGGIGNRDDFVSLSRNGYTSNASSDFLAARYCSEIIYWDGERAQRMQPHLGLGPEPYDW